MRAEDNDKAVISGFQVEWAEWAEWLQKKPKLGWQVDVHSVVKAYSTLVVLIGTALQQLTATTPDGNFWKETWSIEHLRKHS